MAKERDGGRTEIQSNAQKGLIRRQLMSELDPFGKATYLATDRETDWVVTSMEKAVSRSSGSWAVYKGVMREQTR